MNIYFYIEEKLNYHNNFDVVKRKTSKGFIMYFLSSLADINLVNTIIEGNMFFKENVINGSINEVNDIDLAISDVLKGCLLLIYNKRCYIVETRNYPNRSISESESEKSLKGSHDGFTESILVNTALIRRRVNISSYICELFKVGKENKVDVTINYIKGKVDKELLGKIKKKIKDLDIDDSNLTDKSITESIFNQGLSIFPKVRYSERPDIASIHILKGYIVILVDNSSSCVILPTTFFELNESLSDYQLPPFIASINRLFRYFAIILAIFLLPTWFLMCINNYTPNNQIQIIENVNKNNLFFQLITIHIFINAINIASHNQTSLLSTPFTLFASIVLSSIAIQANLLDQLVVFYGALSFICNYSVSNYETSKAISLYSFILIVLVGLFSHIGFIIGSIILFLSLVTINVFDVNYLYPFIPFSFKEFIKKIIKTSYK